MARRPDVRLLDNPFPRDRLEAVAGGQSRLPLRLLPVGARVHARRDQLARFVALLSSRLERYVRVGPQRQALLLAVKAVLQPPQSAARRRDLQVHSAIVVQAVRRFLWLSAVYFQLVQ